MERLVLAEIAGPWGPSEKESFRLAPSYNCNVHGNPLIETEAYKNGVVSTHTLTFSV